MKVDEAAKMHAQSRSREVNSPREIERLEQAFIAGAAWMWREIELVGTKLPPSEDGTSNA